MSMDTITCIKTRRSVRKFLDKKVEREVVEQLVELAKWAPSWNNCKAVRYTVVDQEENLKKLAKNWMAPENVHIVDNAPLVFVVSNVKKRSGYERDGYTSTDKGDAWEMFDAGTACQTLCLAANEMGLGTVIMGTFDEEGVSLWLDLPENETIIAMAACGYPNVIPNPPRRKEVSDILRYQA